MKTLELTRGKSADGKILYINDATDTYGTDLPARNTLALVPYITYQKSGGELEVITPSPFSVSDVETFTIDVEDKDGIYYARVYALPKYTSGPLSDGDIVYDTNTQSVSKMISGTLTAVALSSLASEDVDYGEINSMIDTALVILRDQMVLVAFQKKKDAIQNRCEMMEYNEAKQNLDYIILALYTAKIKFCAGEYAVAQQEIDTAIDLATKALKLDQ